MKNASEQLLIADAQLRRRHLGGRIFYWVCCAATLVGVLFLVALLGEILYHGLPWLSWNFLTNFPSRFPEQAGIRSSLAGSLWLISLIIAMAVPIGFGAAVYLEEYARPSRLNTLIEINIGNLAGVPSIVYGILGLTIFVRWMALERSVIAGALTMTLLVLPVIITAGREALRAVPSSIRHAAYGLGATQWQTIRAHVLPAAMPGMLTGVILALSRAIGETAPLIMIGALTYVAFTPAGIFDAFTALPIQIFNWASRPQPAFHDLAAAAIVVLLAVLLSLNAVAIALRHYFEKRLRW